jgi:hypothetical protein
VRRMLGCRVSAQVLMKNEPSPAKFRGYPPSAYLRPCERLEIVSRAAYAGWGAFGVPGRAGDVVPIPLPTRDPQSSHR